jgi:hypothetical protein
MWMRISALNKIEMDVRGGEEIRWARAPLTALLPSAG